MAASPKLARYEVLGRLATGGMAEVWVVRFVLKTIIKSLAADPRFTQMFINEARLAAVLSRVKQGETRTININFEAE